MFSNQFLNSTLDYDWDMSAVDRSFDSARVNEYLNILNEPDASFVADLINNTKYINYQQFKENLFNSFQLFKKNIGNQPFSIVLSTEKIGSEHWIVALLWSEIKQMNFRQFIDEIGENSVPLFSGEMLHILVIDDGLYTGINTFNKIDGPTVNLAKKLKMKHKDMCQYFNYHFVIPFVSTAGDYFIKDNCDFLGIGYNFYAANYMPVLEEIVDIPQYYPGNSDEILRDKFEISLNFDLSISNMPAFYFDHKVAAPESTFSSIYLQGKIPGGGDFGSLFKRNPSREKIEQLELLYNEWSDI